MSRVEDGRIQGVIRELRLSFFKTRVEGSLLFVPAGVSGSPSELCGPHGV